MVESILINNISRVIVAENYKPVGIITYHDFVPSNLMHPARSFTDLEELNEVQWEPWMNQFNVKSIVHALTFRASDIMTKDPLVIPEKESIDIACLMMLRYIISGIPVVNNKDNLTGVVTKKDIAKFIARQ